MDQDPIGPKTRGIELIYHDIKRTLTTFTRSPYPTNQNTRSTTHHLTRRPNQNLRHGETKYNPRLTHLLTSQPASQRRYLFSTLSAIFLRSCHLFSAVLYHPQLCTIISFPCSPTIPPGPVSFFALHRSSKVATCRNRIHHAAIHTIEHFIWGDHPKGREVVIE